MLNYFGDLKLIDNENSVFQIKLSMTGICQKADEDH